MLYQAWTKKNAFNQKKKETVPLLLSCSLTVVQVRPPSSNFDVTSSLFSFSFSSQLRVVQFYSANLSREQTVRCLQCPNVSLRSTFFLPCCSLGLCKAPWVLFPLRLCPVLCLWPVLCTVVSPLIMRCLSYLKKATRHLTWGTMYNAVSSLFSIVSVSVRGKPNKSIVPCVILCFTIPTNWKRLTAAFFVPLLFWAKSTHNPLHKINVRICCEHLCGLALCLLYYQMGGKQGAIDSRKTRQSRFPSSAWIFF